MASSLCRGAGLTPPVGVRIDAVGGDGERPTVGLRCQKQNLTQPMSDTAPMMISTARVPSPDWMVGSRNVQSAAAAPTGRLGDTGVDSYHAEAEPRALRYPICAMVRISPTSTGLRQIPPTARETPKVTDCYRVTGENS